MGFASFESCNFVLKFCPRLFCHSHLKPPTCNINSSAKVLKFACWVCLESRIIMTSFRISIHDNQSYTFPTFQHFDFSSLQLTQRKRASPNNLDCGTLWKYTFFTECRSTNQFWFQWKLANCMNSSSKICNTSLVLDIADPNQEKGTISLCCSLHVQYLTYDTQIFASHKTRGQEFSVI